MKLEFQHAKGLYTSCGCVDETDVHICKHFMSYKIETVELEEKRQRPKALVTTVTSLNTRIAIGTKNVMKYLNETIQGSEETEKEIE